MIQNGYGLTINITISWLYGDGLITPTMIVNKLNQYNASSIITLYSLEPNGIYFKDDLCYHYDSFNQCLSANNNCHYCHITKTCLSDQYATNNLCLTRWKQCSDIKKNCISNHLFKRNCQCNNDTYDCICIQRINLPFALIISFILIMIIIIIT